MSRFKAPETKQKKEPEMNVYEKQTFVEKLATSWGFFWICSEIWQNFPVFRKAEVYLFADLEITTIDNLVIMTNHLIISSRSVTIFRTIASENLSELVNDLGFYRMS